RDPHTALWRAQLHRFDQRKLLAISEYGGAPDLDQMRRFGVYWSYFVSWSGTSRGLPAQQLISVYHSRYVLNRP
ncbi:MAG TPA: hypothetical protein VGS41_03400, partial [Chthonomonadales bacterium]|nr:hypothetical protein [Chthonomonadales bacterium]